MSRKDKKRGFEDMLLRNRFSTRRNVENEDTHGVATPGHMDDGAVDAETRPGPRFDCKQVDAEAVIDRHALSRAPVKIGVDHELAGRDLHFRHVAPLSLSL